MYFFEIIRINTNNTKNGTFLAKVFFIKFIVTIAPYITFFIKFALSGTQERVKDNILIKGVIEILSSNHKLGGLNCNEGKISNSTCIEGYRPVMTDGSNSKTVWGYCFICCKGTPRPVIWIKQDTFLTPFLC